MVSVSWMAQSTRVKCIPTLVRYHGLIEHPVALESAGEPSATVLCSQSVFIVKDVPRVKASASDKYTTGVDASRFREREPKPRAIPYHNQTAGCDESSLTGIGRLREYGYVARGLDCWPLQIDDLVGVALTTPEGAVKLCPRVGQFWIAALSHVNRRIGPPAAASRAPTPPHPSDTQPRSPAEARGSLLLLGILCECFCCAVPLPTRLQAQGVSASPDSVNSHEDVPYARNQRTWRTESDRVPRSR